MDWDESSHFLKVSVPRYAQLDTDGPHCVSLEITVWLPENGVLADLFIEALSLAVRVLDDTKINVSGRSKFTTFAGNVSFPQIDERSASPSDPTIAMSSRRISVETIAGSITGSFPLFDYLGLSTQSGSISVHISPQPILKSAPAIHGPPSSLCARNYTTSVLSGSGNIRGSFILGFQASFRSTAGSLNLEILPIIETGTSSATFDTYTISGTTGVALLDPIFYLPQYLEVPDQKHPSTPFKPVGDGDPYLITHPNPIASPTTTDSIEKTKGKLRCLHSSHKSTAGSISIRYPPAWEGFITASTISGDISVTGKGLKMIKDSKGWVGREVLASKGVDEEEEGSDAKISGVAGGLTFRI